MAEPVSICILAVIGAIALSSKASDLYRNRFWLFHTRTYCSGEAEYKILWDILTDPNHMASTEVVKIESRPDPTSGESTPIIIDIARFELTNNAANYKLWLVHDSDQFGRFCIRMMCFSRSALGFYNSVLFGDEKNFVPSMIFLANCSPR